MLLPWRPSRPLCPLIAACAAAFLQLLGPAAPAVASATPRLPAEHSVWFSPDPAPFAEGGGGSLDYESLWVQGSAWTVGLSHAGVFQLRLGHVEQATDGQLRSIIGFLAAHGVALGLEAGALDRTTCGLGVEGFQLPGEVEASAQRIKNLGGVLAYVAMDEPFASYYSTSPNACHWAADRIAFEFHSNVAKLRAIFPNLVVGEEELYAVPGVPPAQALAELESWLTTYRLVTGETMPFLHLDVDWRVDGWPAAALALESFERGTGTVPGQIYNGQGGSSDTEWIQLAEGRMAAYERQAGGHPEQAVIMSWNFYPRYLLPETDPTTLTSLLDYYHSNYVDGGPFTAVMPYRALDTRASGRLGPDQALTFPVLGSGGQAGVPPSGVGAVALNVTVTNPTAPSYLTVYPKGGYQRPLASNLNFGPGQTVANLVQVRVGDSGGVSVYNAEGYADVVVDVQGWYGTRRVTGTAGLFRPLPVPLRILDTRPASQVGPFGSPFPANSIRQLPVAHRLPDPRAAAVLVNVTAVSGSATSYLTVYPGADAGRPESSNVNFPAGGVVPNRAVVRLGGAGLSLYNAAGQVDVIVDVVGWFTDGSDVTATGGVYHALQPARVYDTRGVAALTAGESRRLMMAGQGGIPPLGVASMVATLTATGAAAATYLTAFPSDAPLPTASDLNPPAGATVANLVAVRLGTDGALRIYDSAASADILLDIVGWYG